MILVGWGISSVWSAGICVPVSWSLMITQQNLPPSLKQIRIIRWAEKGFWAAQELLCGLVALGGIWTCAYIIFTLMGCEVTTDQFTDLKYIVRQQGLWFHLFESSYRAKPPKMLQQVSVPGLAQKQIFPVVHGECAWASSSRVGNLFQTPRESGGFCEITSIASALPSERNRCYWGVWGKKSAGALHTSYGLSI